MDIQMYAGEDRILLCPFCQWWTCRRALGIWCDHHLPIMGCVGVLLGNLRVEWTRARCRTEILYSSGEAWVFPLSKLILIVDLTLLMTNFNEGGIWRCFHLTARATYDSNDLSSIFSQSPLLRTYNAYILIHSSDTCFRYSLHLINSVYWCMSFWYFVPMSGSRGQVANYVLVRDGTTSEWFLSIYQATLFRTLWQDSFIISQEIFHYNPPNAVQMRFHHRTIKSPEALTLCSKPSVGKQRETNAPSPADVHVVIDSLSGWAIVELNLDNGNFRQLVGQEDHPPENNRRTWLRAGLYSNDWQYICSRQRFSYGVVSIRIGCDSSYKVK